MARLDLRTWFDERCLRLPPYHKAGAADSLSLPKLMQFQYKVLKFHIYCKRKSYKKVLNFVKYGIILGMTERSS